MKRPGPPSIVEGGLEEAGINECLFLRQKRNNNFTGERDDEVCSIDKERFTSQECFK
jgi:hypothetical protein